MQNHAAPEAKREKCPSGHAVDSCSAAAVSSGSDEAYPCVDAVQAANDGITNVDAAGWWWWTADWSHVAGA